MNVRICRGIVAAALSVALAVAGGCGLGARDETSRTSEIETSFAFDVTNLRYLMGYADNVFVGEVQSVVGKQDAHTQYEVQVQDSLKGQLEGDVVVSQLGTATDGETQVTEDQPLLRVGQTYLLVTSWDANNNWQTLIAGPKASVPINDQKGADSVKKRYRDAIERQQYPPGVQPKE